MSNMRATVTAVIAATMFAIAVPFSSAVAADNLPALPANLAAPAKVTPMPEFSFADLHGGTLQSSDMKGKVVVIRFWATW